MRAAIYARYSSELQSDTSIDDQVRLCRERADRDGMTVAEVFTDHAISGSHLNNRQGMLSLLDRVKKNDFDIVIAEALDRISRDQEDIAAIYKRLNHAEVRIITLSEGEINELHIGLKGTMNALFLKDLAVKTRRGQRGRVEAGKIPGGNSYGYKIVRRLLDDGSVSTGEREIDPDQAAVIKGIFREYTDGIAPRRIAGRLNAIGVPSPRGGQWNASTTRMDRHRCPGAAHHRRRNLGPGPAHKGSLRITARQQAPDQEASINRLGKVRVLRRLDDHRQPGTLLLLGQAGTGYL